MKKKKRNRKQKRRQEKRKDKLNHFFLFQLVWNNCLRSKRVYETDQGEPVPQLIA